MSHLTAEQYTEVASAYRGIQTDNETVDIEDTSPAHIESVIALFYEPSDYWLWHPDTLLVDAIEDVVGFGIDELVGASA